MEYLIWAGGALSILGMLGLAWCVLIVVRAKRKGLSEDELRAIFADIDAVIRTEPGVGDYDQTF